MIEQSLIKQLGQELPELYLRSFRNEHTNTITTDIPTLLEHLFTTYGAIEPEELQEKVDTLRQKVFEIAEPLIIMYNEVNELQDLATASGNPFTPKQLIAIGIQLIKNLNDFEKGLTTWYDLLPAQQTWPRFQTHFETARALYVASVGFPCAILLIISKRMLSLEGFFKNFVQIISNFWTR